MRTLGINYDTGVVVDGTSTRAAFDDRTVRRELEIIAGDLHANAVRPGDGLHGRLATMTDPATWSTPDGRAALAAGLARARDTLRTVATHARAAFAGPITYASGTWEEVDWKPFDVVLVDAYRGAAGWLVVDAARYLPLLAGMAGRPRRPLLGWVRRGGRPSRGPR